MHNRFYCPKANIKEKGTLITNRKQLHHIVNVLRFGTGDKIVVFDGQGKDYQGVIKNLAKNEIEISIEKITQVNKDPVLITLACAVPKRAKLDFIVEKCTELGIDRIIPMKTARSEVSFNKQKMLSKVNHWQQIAINSSEQSQRSFIPEINELNNFETIISEIDKYELAIMPVLKEKSNRITEAIKGFRGKSLIVFIGPEGDFTKEEVKLAQVKGVKLVTLGPRVLKIDTAAISVTAILNFLLEAKR
jgi:16S rRNA (uracil1498-N3)-methyltransferase